MRPSASQKISGNLQVIVGPDKSDIQTDSLIVGSIGNLKMIRGTLPKTGAATFSILLPDPNIGQMPIPTGTGFFVSPDGWFVTAAHVVCQNGKERDDIGAGWLMKESAEHGPKPMCQSLSLEYTNSDLDLALIKVNFEENRAKEWLKEMDVFPHLSISSRLLSIGEPVYSFGYPLSDGNLVHDAGGVKVGSTELCPRVTSAIISSTLEKTAMIMSSGDPQVYVLDKALNYGNSGGPIIAAETGHVHAVCTRFQPVYIKQAHLERRDGYVPSVMIPSLYGVVSSLQNKAFLEKCAQFDISIDEA